jgi:hypothetical protein
MSLGYAAIITGSGGCPFGSPGRIFGADSGSGTIPYPYNFKYTTDWKLTLVNNAVYDQTEHYDELWISDYGWGTHPYLNNIFYTDPTTQQVVEKDGVSIFLSRGSIGGLTTLANPPAQIPSLFKSFVGGNIGQNASTSWQRSFQSIVYPISSGVAGRAYVVVNGGIISTGSSILPPIGSAYTTPMKGSPVIQGDYDNIKSRLSKIVAANPNMGDLQGNQLFGNQTPGTYYFTVPQNQNSIFVSAAAGGGGGSGSLNATFWRKCSGADQYIL